MRPPAPTAARPDRPSRPTARWWRRPWILPLSLCTLVFLALSVPPYTRLDPDAAPIPIREDPAWYFPLLVTHILAGTVLMLLAIVQVWPRARRRHPTLHRWSGRAYVAIGVPLVGVPALLIAPLSNGGASVAISNTVWAAAWLSFTLTGFLAARRRRPAAHRAWMLRGFTLVFSVALSRLTALLLVLLTLPRLDSAYGGDMEALVLDVAPASAFLSWALPLLFVEWWLKYRAPHRRTGAR